MFCEQKIHGNNSDYSSFIIPSVIQMTIIALANVEAQAFLGSLPTTLIHPVKMWAFFTAFSRFIVFVNIFSECVIFIHSRVLLFDGPFSVKRACCGLTVSCWCLVPQPRNLRCIAK
jgi:hypothetical protein